MRGYNFPINTQKEELEETQVYCGCLQCNRTWYEKRMMYPSTPRINGPQPFQRCDMCITEAEKMEIFGYKSKSEMRRIEAMKPTDEHPFKPRRY